MTQRNLTRHSAGWLCRLTLRNHSLKVSLSHELNNQLVNAMAFTLNGIGTTFYGQRDFRDDGSYLTTEWFVFLYVPLIPIRSLRVVNQGPSEPGWHFGYGPSESYGVCEKRFPPDWKQVLMTYGYIALLASWACLVVSVALRLVTHPFDTALGVILIFLACAIPVPTPWILRRYATRNFRT